MRLIKYFSILLLLTGMFLWMRPNEGEFQEFEGSVFGTYYHIKIRGKQADNSLHEKILETLNKVNNQMSVFKIDSEISQINKYPAKKSVTLSEDMAFLLQNAQTVWKESHGAFDPAIGKLVDLWGFGPNRKQKTPSSAEIKKVLNQSGMDKLIFSKDYSELSKKNTVVNLNLSAIAKGFGVDKVAETLNREGYLDYIIEIGGEVRASGYKDGKKTPWSIGVASPSIDGKNAEILQLTNTSLATSGDYRNFYYKNGKRYGHTISPITGYPVEHNLVSVTVIHPLCMLADAYATAFMSMGETEAINLADKLGIQAVFFVEKEPDNLEIIHSRSWK